MRRAPKIIARRPSKTTPIRAHDDREAIDRFTALIIEDMRHGVTSDQLWVREGRTS